MPALPALRRLGLAALLSWIAATPGTLRAEDRGAQPGGAADAPAAPDPRTLSDAEKAARLAEVEKVWEDNRRNQDLVPVRTRRNGVILLGDLRYQPAAKFLRKVLDDDRDMTTRVAAFIAIGKCGDFETTESSVRWALANVKKDPVFAASLPRMFATVEDEKSLEWISTRLDQREDDVVASVVEATGLAKRESAVPALERLLATSKDPAVRFECLRAIGRCGGKDGAKTILRFLHETDWRIRMAAAEGLGFTGDPSLIADLRTLVTRGEEPVVAETALEGIARLGTKDAFEPLIDGLKVTRLRARQKCRAALRRLAKELHGKDKDYGVDPNAWTVWWNKIKMGLDPDDPAYKGSETVSYFKFPIQSDRVLFILDISGSMDWPDAPRDSGIRPSDWRGRRIDRAHAELFKALRALAEQNRGRIPKGPKKNETTDLPYAPSEAGDEPPTLFNLATFAGVVTPWKDAAVLATKENVEDGIAWIQKQLPRGGTATFDALDFGIKQQNIDTIFFLSDGVPSLGRIEEREGILAELRRRNRFNRVTIHTIALIIGLSPYESARKYEDPADMADIMRRIAADHQGDFADESKQ